MEFVEWVGLEDGDNCVYAMDYIEECGPKERGSLLDLRIVDQLQSYIVMSDAAAWEVPNLGIGQEEFAHGGFKGTIAELLIKVKSDIDMMREGYPESDQADIDLFLKRVDNTLDNSTFVAERAPSCCHIRIRDPSGLSTILNNGERGDARGEWLTEELFERSFKDDDNLGLVATSYDKVDAAVQIDNSSAAAVAMLLKTAKRVTLLSGAGISVESGIPPFRSSGIESGTEVKIDATGASTTAGSIWRDFDAAQMTVQGFNKSDSVAQYWWHMKHSLLPKFMTAQPNAAHQFFQFLDAEGQLGAIVTQNIDSLHSVAGVSVDKILEIHGHMRGLICSDNGATPYNPIPRGTGGCSYSLTDKDALAEQYYPNEAVPKCPLCKAPLRTETVMFNQPLPTGLYNRAVEEIGKSDVLMVIGTSLIVEPVNALPAIALRKGIPVVMINLDATQYDVYATALVKQPASSFLQEVRELMR